MRLPTWARGILSAVVGGAIGVVAGFVVGMVIGFMQFPGSNPHNYDGFARLVSAVMGAIAGGVIGLIGMLVRFFLSLSSKTSSSKSGGNEEY